MCIQGLEFVLSAGPRTNVASGVHRFHLKYKNRVILIGDTKQGNAYCQWLSFLSHSDMLKATFKLILNVAFIFTLYSVSPML